MKRVCQEGELPTCQHCGAGEHRLQITHSVVFDTARVICKDCGGVSYPYDPDLP